MNRFEKCSIDEESLVTHSPSSQPAADRQPSAEADQTEPSSRRYHLVDFNELPGVPCPCGTAKRAFADVADYPATVHVTEISADARTHYHREHTETYYFLKCGPSARMQLDDEIIPVRPGMCILIPPGVRHRAIGEMTIINIVTPKFDPADEYFD